MRIFHDKLHATLQQNKANCWLVFGDEIWQKNDSLAAIKKHGLQQGFDEVIQFTVDEKFDWNILLQEYHSMSLFSARRIIELELMSAKINEVGSKALISIAQQFDPDTLLLIHGNKLDTPTQKRKWFTTLEKNSVFLGVYDIEGPRLQQWIKQQINNLSLNVQADVIPFLAEFFEGNLLALSQELQKLSILFNQQFITIELLEPIIIQQAKFTPFQITDTLFSGHLAKAINMLMQQQQEDVAVGKIIWQLHKELNLLLAMHNELQQGTSTNQLFKKHRIWDKKKPIYQYALSNISQKNVLLAITRLAQTDLLTKTSSDFNAYLLLSDICVSLYYADAVAPLSLDYEYH